MFKSRMKCWEIHLVKKWGGPQKWNPSLIVFLWVLVSWKSEQFSAHSGLLITIVVLFVLRKWNTFQMIQKCVKMKAILLFNIYYLFISLLPSNRKSKISSSFFCNWDRIEIHQTYKTKGPEPCTCWPYLYILIEINETQIDTFIN